MGVVRGPGSGLTAGAMVGFLFLTYRFLEPIAEFTEVLLDAKVKISMDGRGRWIDNRMIERPWRSLKYECVDLNAFGTGSRKGIETWIKYHNERRPHSSHGLLTS